VSKKIRPEHDELFRSSMEHPKVSKEFLDAYLPQDVKERVDLDSIKVEKESFVEDKLKNSICDVLFSVKSIDGDAYIYVLVEHQSKPHHFMPLRLFKYMINICDQYLTKHPKAKILPPIYPMVFYNGKQKYNSPRNLWELFEDRDLAKAAWTGDYQLINVHEIPDEEFKKRPWSGMMEILMKHIRDSDLLQKWTEMSEFLPEYAESVGGVGYIISMMHYSLTVMQEDDTMILKELVREKLNEEEGEEIMASFAQVWFDKGSNEGRLEATYKFAINLLAEGMDVERVAQLTGLSVKEVLSLGKKQSKCA